jgi:hypothetical protein
MGLSIPPSPQKKGQTLPHYNVIFFFFFFFVKKSMHINKKRWIGD